MLSVFFFAGSFIINSPTKRWWSELMSARLFPLTSRSTLLHLLVIDMWSIRFSDSKRGEIHVALYVGLCGNRVPPIISSLRVLKSANRDRSHSSIPYLMPFQLSLSFSILALIFPIATWISLFGIFLMIVCRSW